MGIELGPFPKYENVRYNAYWTRVGINTRLGIDKNNIDDYKAHLQDCNNNPTVGMLARRKYITGKPMDHPIHARCNINDMEKEPEIKSLKDNLKKKKKKIYPNTKHIREYIINNDRVTLDGIEKSKKYTTLNKLIIFCKKFM